ncbi:uncharacterized protein HD556DRAFT_1444551 [Suillus plorans]|uniref:Uncharacterized protein n=1 Tax=Suillus plorans TaxID=116603 RepID=A0A9P7ANS6_9AGAM|nr:uncharacterized protein HD556DRAFT_1444551 [Suillus plorans]KAG1792282.1 hypothetical protein HD556DRAFT_1444551 [Suillus plorans]
MPQQTKLPLIKAEIAVLQAHLEDWRSVKGKDRHQVLKAVHKEACLQAPTRDKALLKARKKTYKEWLYNQCCRKAPKPLIKYGKKWTAHRVLIEQNKARIQEETGEMPGSEAMIVKWPEATKTVLAGLSAEEKEEANVLADKWNNKAALAEVQANVAETKGADIIQHFTTEIFKQAGMRVFVMSAWWDSRGKLIHDHNDQFGGAESFIKTRNWDEIFMLEWRQYAAEQFDVQDDDVPQLLDLEEDDDGLPMLPDTMGLKRGEQQHIIRLFLTRHYRMCMGTNKVKAALPWGELIKNQSNFFNGTYWPADLQVVEPSKIDKSSATALLDFWYDWQKKKLRPTFCFKAWRDTDGNMELVAKSYQKVIRQVSRRHNKANDVPSEESLDEREDHQSVFNNGEEASMSNNAREQTPPGSIIHSSTNSAGARHTKALVTVDKLPALRAAKATKAGKECLSFVPTTRSGKRHAATPISDTPAERTQSKVAIVEAPKPRRGRK